MADPFAYIDLARRGRTGVWPALRGCLWILGFFVLEIVVGIVLVRSSPAFAQRFGLLVQGGAGLWFELGFVAAQSAVVLAGVYCATVLSQKRPFGTLVSGDGSLEIRRVLAGAAAWLAAAALAGLIGGVIAGLTRSAGTEALPKFQPPDAAWYEALAAGLVLIPLQAGGEELVFRGWLTQTIGQWLRYRVALVLLVGVLFALVHSTAPGALVYFTVFSAGLSATTLKDGRLELAIGAHTMQNLFVLQIARPLLEGGQTTLFGADLGAIGAEAVFAALLQSALIYVIATSALWHRLFGLKAA